jgi:hypothetical protein
MRWNGGGTKRALMRPFCASSVFQGFPTRGHGATSASRRLVVALPGQWQALEDHAGWVDAVPTTARPGARPCQARWSAVPGHWNAWARCVDRRQAPADIDHEATSRSGRAATRLPGRSYAATSIWSGRPAAGYSRGSLILYTAALTGAELTLCQRIGMGLNALRDSLPAHLQQRTAEWATPEVGSVSRAQAGLWATNGGALLDQCDELLRDTMGDDQDVVKE